MNDERLPVPSGFEQRLASGESWAVEAEPGWYVTDSEGVCMARRCFRAAVVARDRPPYAICREHLRSGRMWIEGGQVVSWRIAHR